MKKLGSEMTTVNSTIIGAAGEHYVMAELLRRGFIAAKAPEGVPNFDVIVTGIDGDRLAALQVKTRRPTAGGDKGWHMKAKHDTLIADRMFYVFVDLESEHAHPAFFILPSAAVAEACRVSHQIWEQTPGVNGQKHGHSDLRRLLPEYKRNLRMNLTPNQEAFMSSHAAGWLEQYHNAWGLIAG